MTTKLTIPFFSLCAACSLWALPQDFSDLGDLALFGGKLELDGRDLTDRYLASQIWSGEEPLPGDWRQAYALGERSVAHVRAVPYLFGQVPIGVEAVRRGKALEQVSIYYLESGTFYGYRPDLRHSSEGQQSLREKQRRFRQIFDERIKALKAALEAVTGERGRSGMEGRTAAFKQRYLQYEKGGLALRLKAKRDFYVRVDVRRLTDSAPGFVDPEWEELSHRERKQALRRRVVASEGEGVGLEGLPMIYQGGRAYCGITTFLMAAQFLGSTMDPATMASESGFRFGMGGKKMIEAYRAVAREGGWRLNRATKLDRDRVRASIDQGLPVVVWRYFDAHRNRLHRAVSDPITRRSVAPRLPDPDAVDEASWPGAGAPGHASVLTGYHAERGEVRFSDSWGDDARDKRMRWEELEATSYYVFYFSL